jgi:hypothetical protein
MASPNGYNGYHFCCNDFTVFAVFLITDNRGIGVALEEEVKFKGWQSGKRQSVRGGREGWGCWIG